MRIRLYLLVFSAAILANGPVRAASKWLKIRSSHFELYTDAGAKRGNEALARLEQIQQVFRSLGSGRTGSPLPVRVFLFRSAAGYRPFRPAETTLGFYQGGPQHDYIVMQYAGPRTYRVAFHEYVHLILNHSAVRLPRWLEEGTAEFYSTLEATQSHIVVGKPIPEHLQTLAMEAWLDAGTLHSVDRDSPYYNERGKVGVFYAESWALVHMLNLSAAYRGRMPQFVALLEDGAPAGGAFEKAFGKSFEAALADLKAYLGARALPVVEVGAGAAEETTISPPEPLSSLEADLALAELLIQLGNTEEAGKKYRRLARENPAAPEVETGLGALALSRRQYDSARRHLDNAIRLGSTDAQTYFEYAMLLRDSGGDRADVARNLQKAVTLNPSFAEAHFMLGTMLSRENRHGEAAEHLRRAASILPRQAYFWHALALAYYHLGQRESARWAAYRALQAAATEQEAQMAQAALRLIDAKPPPPPDNRPEVTTPESWQPKRGDSHAEGTLRRIDCLGQSARFYVGTEGKTLSLFVRNPGDVLLRNLTSMTFEFRCGPQKPLPVAVEYLAKPDPKLGTDGELVAIEFR